MTTRVILSKPDSPVSITPDCGKDLCLFVIIGSLQFGDAGSLKQVLS